MADLCFLCKRWIEADDARTEVETKKGDLELAHDTCLTEQAEYEQYLEDNADYLRARANGWED